MQYVAQCIGITQTASDRVKAYLPDSCFEGNGGPFKRPADWQGNETEMSAYRYPGGPAPAGMGAPDQNGQMQWGDVKEGETQFNGPGGGVDAHGMSRETIDEWQAGWNVTNAIQVSSKNLF